jgi:hypothetical protein
MKTSLKTYIKNTWMCIKYPFLYPRNRWDDRYHANILSDKLYELDKQSSMLIGVSISLERNTDNSEQKYYRYVFGKDDKFNFEAYLTKIETSTTEDRGFDILNVCNGNSVITHNLNDQLGRSDKFEVLGISICEHLNRPYIKVHVKLKDETDTTNYGFPYYTTRLITDTKIRKKYKFWDWIDKNILDRIFIFPKYTELDALKGYKGWYKIFGEDLLKELRKQLVKDKLLYKFRIRDIKEKWGVLEIYTNYRTEGIIQLLDKYRSLSRKICVYCGKPATYCTKGWVRYICEDCINKENNNKGYTKIK